MEYKFYIFDVNGNNNSRLLNTIEKLNENKYYKLIRIKRKIIPSLFISMIIGSIIVVLGEMI